MTHGMTSPVSLSLPNLSSPSRLSPATNPNPTDHLALATGAHRAIAIETEGDCFLA